LPPISYSAIEHLETRSANLKSLLVRGYRHSFRDPGGFVVWVGGRLFRIVKDVCYPDYLAFEASPTVRRYRDSGSIVSTIPVDPASVASLGGGAVNEIYEEHGGKVLLEHEPLPFPNFPYEWAAEMLHRAVSLTLDLALDLAEEGLTLKDATPYNVMFRGADAVFLDVLSIERRTPGDPIWLSDAQLIRSFLLPLAAWCSFGIPPSELLLTHHDGLEPESVYRWLSVWGKFLWPWLTLVSIPAWLSRFGRAQGLELHRRKLLSNDDQARFILTSRLRSLRRTARKLAPPFTSSAWSGYMEGNHSYNPDQFAVKEEFVRAALKEFSPRRVLDVGCNNGHFSFLAARNGAETVAIDLDPVMVGQVWRRATAEAIDVLPLVVNLARPTPAMGWNAGEHPSFLERARNRFDLVLMLAVLHHLWVTDRVPVEEILETVADLTTNLALIEYVGPQDPMFRKLTRGRDHLHRDLNPERFEVMCQKRFDIVRSASLENSARCLYLLRVRKPRW
jgi:SAM-dependent methyltransferase